MPSYKSPNSAQNINLGGAKDFVKKLSALALPMGAIFVNPTGAEPINYIPIDEATDLSQDDSANLLVMANGDFHNIAMLKHMFNQGRLHEFQAVATELGLDPRAAALNIPGVVGSIEKLIAKA